MDDGLIDLEGNSIYYREAHGAGRSVAFVHGWASSSRMWVREMQALGGAYRCLALDLPGHGQSSNPPAAWYSLDSFVGVTHEWIRALSAAPVALVGHSLGGTIALEVALRHPDEVTDLVLVNPVITGRLRSNPGWLHRPAPSRIIGDLARRLWPRLSTHMQQALATDRLPLLRKGYLRRNLEDMALASADSLLGSARAARSDVSRLLHDVRVPTLVVIGRRDRTVPPQEGRLAATLIPGAQLVELPTDHHPSDQAPEAFLEALRRFLDRPSAT